LGIFFFFFNLPQPPVATTPYGDPTPLLLVTRPLRRPFSRSGPGPSLAAYARE